MSRRDQQPAKEARLSDISAERAVLGAVLRSREAFWKVSQTLTEQSFVGPGHSRIYAAVRDALESGKTASITLISTMLGEVDADGTPWDWTLSALAKSADDGGQVGDFADVVSDCATRRQLKAVGEALSGGAGDGNKPVSDVAALAEKALLDALAVTSPKRPRRLDDIAGDVAAGRSKDRGPNGRPLSTGLVSLDEILGDILPGDLGFILGAPKDGKSSLATQIGMHVSRTRPVLMIQLEMSDEQVAARELAAASGLTVAQLYGEQRGFDDDARIAEGVRAVGVHDFFVLELPKVTVRQIRSSAIAMQRSHGLGVIIVDQLDKITSDQNYRDRFERTTEITRDLKALAKEMAVPIIVPTQRTRSAIRRDDPTPQISDGDAPSIERDADWVIGVWRKENWLRANRPQEKRGGEAMDTWLDDIARAKGVANIIVLARRRGEAYGEHQFRWEGAFTRFHEL